MEAYECVLSRRSIRQFTGEPVDEPTIERLLRAAVAAPSAGNQQPWHFVVIRSPEGFAQIMESHPHSAMMATASAAILVCGEVARQKYDGYWVQDCAAAT